jgi:hypothetical protein
MSIRFLLTISAGAMLAAASPASAAFTINFANYLGADNPLVVPTTDGNTVTFDSPSGAGTFDVEDTNGVFAGFNAGLVDFNYSTITFVGDTLTVSFANPIAGGVTFPFAIEDAFENFGSDFLTISSNNGVTAVANGSPDTLALQNPEGVAYINAPGATELTITSANPYAIGNVDVPEPMTLSVLGFAFAGLAAARRRRA